MLEDASEIEVNENMGDETALERALRKRILEDAVKCRAIKYNPHDFLDMVQRHGAVEACRIVVMKDPYTRGPTGFEKLRELSHLELTIEYTIQEPQWHPLFDQTVRDHAMKRLNQYDPHGTRVSRR
jgi:hypothetical protein